MPSDHSGGGTEAHRLCQLRPRHDGEGLQSSGRRRLSADVGAAGGPVLTQRACGDGSLDVKEIKSSARKRRISGLFRRFGFEARLLKKLGFLIWKLSEYWFDESSKLQRWENILHGVFQ